MKGPWLILDCNYLCHRAKHTTGYLKHHETPTGVIFGVLKTIQSLQNQFNTNRIVFCWDSKKSKRREFYPGYKANRLTFRTPSDEITEEETIHWEMEYDFHRQMKKLRRRYLPMIGFRNIIFQQGYEADDHTAMACNTLRKHEQKSVIVSSDHDMYQILYPKMVSMYSPSKRETITYTSFIQKYGIDPKEWANVLSIAGCSGDSVPGVKGVGEVTAIKYITKELTQGCQAHLSIEASSDIIERTRMLVTLPFPGTQSFKKKKDDVTQSGWRQVAKLLGFRSMEF